MPLDREVLATCEPDDTVTAAEAMADAQARAQQAELDAHEEHLLVAAADDAHRRRVRDRAAAQRAELGSRHHAEALAARECRMRAKEADSLASALNRPH
jgi:hypothetical protein